MAEPSEPSPNTQQWWSKFGDAYDEAAKEDLSKMGGAADEPSDGTQPSQPTAESQRAPRPEEALADQMVLNQRTLAQLRAKAQLLEVAETANARLQSELSELRATSEAREAALHKALGESRAAADALQASFTDAAAEAARCRQAAEQARSGVVSQGADHEEERTALNAMIKEAQEARDAAVTELREVRTAALESEAERGALRAALDAERGGGGTLDRLAKMLAKGPTTTTTTTPEGDAVDAASVAARIETLSKWAEERVEKAEKAAEAAVSEAALLTIQLNNAPKPEMLKAQTEYAADARAKCREITLQLKQSERDAAATRVRLDAVTARAEAAEAALARFAAGQDSPSPRPPLEPVDRFAQPTLSSSSRRAGVPPKAVLAGMKSAQAQAKRAALRKTSVAKEEEAAPAPEAAAPPPADEVVNGATESSEVFAILLEFLRAATMVVEPPLPSGTDIVLEEEERMGGGEASSETDIALVRANAATTLHRARMYVDLAQQLQPMLKCLQQITAALRERRLLRSVREEMSDGTLVGIANEIEGMVEAEAKRAADLAGMPQGVAQHVLHKLQQDLEIKSVGEIGPRVDELTRAARLSLSLLKQMRAALDLDKDASMSMTIATATRYTKERETMSTVCNHLCAMVQVGSVEALVPAVRQICLSSPTRMVSG